MQKLLLVLLCGTAFGQLTPELRDKIDKLTLAALAKTGAPSASIAIVKDGTIAYLNAYGDARIDPKMSATIEMRYAVGSISKQFTAAALLLLQEQGKLSLDDKVSKFVPGLTRGKDISIRQLLSHTSGYQDYWPQDYVMPAMLEPVTAQKVMDSWAKKPLDFEPGTKWQYSNTNFVIAGVIAEKAAGKPLFEFLREKIFLPLGMTSVTDVDRSRLPEADPAAYFRYAVGPLRPAPKEGSGWLFAAGELAMTARDLAKWDISVMEQKLMKAASYREFERETLLADGAGTRYGLGVDVNVAGGRRVLSHDGEVSGFSANNVVYPEDRAAIVVLTNLDSTPAMDQISSGIAPLLLTGADPVMSEKLEQAKRIFAGLQHGTIDRSLLTENANFYFNDQALRDFQASLSPIGEPQEFVQTNTGLRGGMRLRSYSIRAGQTSLRAWTYEMPDGKLEQYQIAPAN